MLFFLGALRVKHCMRVLDCIKVLFNLYTATIFLSQKWCLFFMSAAYNQVHFRHGSKQYEPEQSAPLSGSILFAT